MAGRFSGLLACVLLTSCASAPRLEQDDTIGRVLEREASLAPVRDRAEEFRLQLLLTRVVDPPMGSTRPPRVIRSGYRVDAEYFYPASTIKLAGAIAAALELQERAGADQSITWETPARFHALDPAAPATDTTLGMEVRKLFLVSDNPAFNRLYDFVGQDRLNGGMRAAGLASTRIMHRLSVSRTPEQNRQTPRIEFTPEGRNVVVYEPRMCEPDGPAIFLPQGLTVGTGFQRGDGSVAPAMNFESLNRISLVDLHDMLVLLARPDLAAALGKQAFPLTEADRQVLLATMRELPRESPDPVYDPSDYPDDYGKFLLPGFRRAGVHDVAIANKIGQAYGFTIENAYVTPTVAGADRRESFFITAVIYTNADGVLNDDHYEYDAVALPFMADLGEALARELLR
jgi:hypothetical protein